MPPGTGRPPPVDYKRVTELRGVDLEQYRGRGREEARVTVGS